MITGINLAETKDFTSQYDKGNEKTIWKIGALPSKVNAHIGSMFERNQGNIEGMIEATRFGLKGFSAFKNHNGDDISFSTSSRPLGGKNYHVVAESTIDLIPIEILIEIGAEVLKCSKLNEEEIKN